MLTMPTLVVSKKLHFDSPLTYVVYPRSVQSSFCTKQLKLAITAILASQSLLGEFKINPAT